MLYGINDVINIALASGEELATNTDIIIYLMTLGLTEVDLEHFDDVLYSNFF